MKLRGITKSMIEEAIFTPEQTGRGYSDRILAFKTFARGLLKVVYSVEYGNHIIVSAIWEEGG